MSEREFAELVRSAKAAEERGEYRIAADKYLKATKTSPSKWTDGRWQAFLDYSRLLQDHTSATEKDMKALKRLTRDEKEPVLFRSQALFLRGNYEMERDDLESAAIYFGRALHLIPTAKAAEKKRTVKIVVGNEAVRVSVSDQLENLKNNVITPNLEFLEDPAQVDRKTLASVPKINGRPHQDIVKRLVVGGGQCDCCGKKRTDVDENFFRCTRCKKAYYCSPACQERQWKNGHAAACREPGKPQPGDYMVLKGLSKQELNGTLVKIKGEADVKNRWAVLIEGKSNPISVASEKLVHIRPAK